MLIDPKCDESGPPCRACTALDIPCTFERPSRRRGPPNRHAEAIKRRRIEGDPTLPPLAPPAATGTQNVAATLASFSSHAIHQLSAESICPFPILELLVDDFFTYIHPLAPFPHEPSFRAAFKQREDLTNPSFLALLASMMAILVASFPRKPMAHLKSHHQEKLFPNSVSLVERCHKVAVEARGSGYLDKELTVYDAVTSYFLGLSGAYTINWRQCRLYFGETFTISRVLGVHRATEPAKYTNDYREQVDFIKQEIGRRLFWVMVVGIRSMQQLGATFAEFTIPPPTPTHPYPPLPTPVDDEYIFVDHIAPQPPGSVSKLAGFNVVCEIYMTCTPLATMELAYGIDELFDWPRQKRILEECLENVKRTLQNIPAELRLEAGKEPGMFGHEKNRAWGGGIGRKADVDNPPLRDEQTLYYPHAQPKGFGRIYGMERREPETPVDPKRHLQYEIQKANIYASQLGTRSYLVEKYWNLLDAHNALVRGEAAKPIPEPVVGTVDASASAAQRLHLTPNMLRPRLLSRQSTFLSPMERPSAMHGLRRDADDDEVELRMSNERELIVKDLLKVLSSISQVNMEPNGGSFINKIRQIASTLLDTPRNHKGPLALRAEEYLGRFLEVLMKLEGTSSGGKRSTLGAEGEGAGEGEIDEEDELRNWADLREYQTRFMRSGGFLE